MKSMTIKSYSEMKDLETFQDRLEYLYIGDMVGHQTFGSSRYLNQTLYKSREWKRVRDVVIIRDRGCDLGIDGCDLTDRNVLVHHINPITIEDVINRHPKIFDPDNLITLSLKTHNYIHYGNVPEQISTSRTANDTCPWKARKEVNK